MSKSCRRNGSGELDVFEAALYFSGEVNEASLIGIQRTRRVAAERRSVDAPPSREAMEVIFHRLTNSESKPKDKGERQPCPPGGKLANVIRSFFNVVISRKKNSEYVEKQRKSRERDQKATSLLSQREIWLNVRSAKSNKCCNEKGEASVAKGEWHGKQKRRMVEEVIPAPTCLSSGTMQWGFTAQNPTCFRDLKLGNSQDGLAQAQ